MSVPPDVQRSKAYLDAFRRVPQHLWALPSARTSGNRQRLGGTVRTQYAPKIHDSSNFLTQPFFLRVSTIRSDGVRWTVAWDSQSGASAATVVAYGTVPTIVPETRQNSVSRANATQLASSVKWKNVKVLRGKTKMVERRLSVKQTAAFQRPPR